VIGVFGLPRMMSRACSVFIPLVEMTLGMSGFRGSPSGSTVRRISTITSPAFTPALYAGLPLIGVTHRMPSLTRSRRIEMPIPLYCPRSWDSVFLIISLS